MRRLTTILAAALIAAALPAGAQNLEKDVRDFTVSFRSAAAVTPSDSTDLPVLAKAIYVGGAGNLKVDLVGTGHGVSTVTFTAVPVGTVLRIQAKRVYTTGTTATNLLSLY